MVAGVRVPRDRIEVRPFVDLLADGLTLAIDHAQCLMDDVAVLRMSEADQAAIGRKPACPRRLESADPDGGRTRPDESRSSGGGNEVGAIVLLRADPKGDLARSRERDPLSPACRETFDQGPSLGTVEGGGHPSPGLVPDVVLPPHHPSIRRDQRFFHPDRLVREPAPSSGVQVRGPDLPGAVLVRREGEKAWGAVYPGGEAHLGRGESPLPRGGIKHGSDDGTGAVRLVSRETLALESLALGVAEC